MKAFYKQYGMRILKEGKLKSTYEVKCQEEGSELITIFHVLPGIDIISYNCQEHYEWNGLINETSESLEKYYCISFYVEGIYQSKIAKNKYRYIAPGNIDIIRDKYKCLYAEMLSDTMVGFNIMVFPVELDLEVMKFYKENFNMDIEKLIYKLDRVIDFGTITPTQEVLHVLGELMKGLTNENIFWLRLKIIELFIIFLGENWGMQKAKRNFSSEQIKITKSIQKKMISNLSERITIKELCKEAQISETIFNECFKFLYQCTPHNFIRHFKMEKAIDYLKKNELSIIEIAQNVGYDNPSNFSRAFKEVIGILPSDYRNKYLK